MTDSVRNILIAALCVAVSPTLISAPIEDANKCYSEQATMSGTMTLTAPKQVMSPTAERAFLHYYVRSTMSITTFRQTKGELTSFLSGTGVFISAEGHLLTAYHVIDGADHIEVTGRRMSDDGKGFTYGETTLAKVVATSKKHDLALLKLSDSTQINFTVAMPDTSWQGVHAENLWYIGTTTNWGHGEIRVPYFNDEGVFTVMVNVTASQGDSGGPLLTEDGRLVGILRSVNKEENLTFFTALREFLHDDERQFIQPSL